MNISLGLVFKIAMILVALFMSFMLFRAVMKFLRKTEEAGKDAIKNIDRNHIKKGDMSASKLRLSKLGICYRLGDYNLNPSKYVILRSVAAILVMLVLILLGAKAFSVLGLPVGYIGVDFLFKALNKRDNDKLSLDICNTYSNLKIQLSSGIYLGDCLDYTYGIAQNKRYKEALKELVLNFSDKTKTSSEAIEIFKNRFSCREIDKLCSMLNGFAQYGISENYLKDMVREIQSLLAADASKTQHSIESKTGVITFGFFAIIIGIVAISMISGLNGDALFSI